MPTRNDKKLDADFYESVLDALPVHVFVVDADGEGLYANRQAIELAGKMGLPGGLLESDIKTLVARIPATGANGATDAPRPIERALAGEATRSQQTIRMSGGEIVADVFGAPIYGADGSLSHALSAFLNITDKAKERQRLALRNRELEEQVSERTRELEEARNRAEQASLAKGQFLAGMSHEIRSPLNTILGFTRILQRDSNLNGEQAEYIGHVASSAEHLLSVVNDVLDLSKIEAGQSELHEEAFLMGRLIESVQRMYKKAAVDKGLQIEVQSEEGLSGYLWGDEGKIRQVLINLVGNALKFTEHGGVRIEARRSGPDVALSVADTGVGLHAQELERVFDHFKQTQQGRKAGGTGLGLPISRALARLMGGDLTAESKRGKGSCFTLRVPLCETEGPCDAADPDDLAASPGLPQDLDILVVDDEQADRFALTRLLAVNDWSIREAASGQECLQAIHERRPDIVLMDLSMADLGGAETTRMIRAEWGADSGILVVTAAAFGNEEQLAMEAGADAFLRKPVTDRALIQAMRAVLDLVEARRQQAQVPDEAVDLARIPEGLRSAMRSAVERADIDTLSELIEQTVEYDEKAAGELRRLSRHLAYDEMIELLGDAPPDSFSV